MLNYLQKASSIRNLSKGDFKGQVATLLILIIAGVLIFTLIVANVGQIATSTTHVANVADSASLALASQLATKSYQISKSLMESCGNPVGCYAKTGILSSILAAVMAIIAVTLMFIPGMQPFGIATMTAAAAMTAAGAATLVIAGAIGGIIGGAIGGAIAGTGALAGAIQGAVIGAGIGGAVAGGISAGGNFFGTPMLIMNPATGVVSTITFPSIGGAILGASLGTALSVASSTYNAYAKDAMRGDAMAVAAKSLSGLNEKQGIREGIFLQALSQIVDDPNKVQDGPDGDYPGDSDHDGNFTEFVPNFQVCWDKRITWLKDRTRKRYGLREPKKAVKAFLRKTGGGSYSFKGAVKNFQKAIDDFLKVLNRYEVEGNDGIAIELFRALEDAGYEVPFWVAGPDKLALEDWRDWDPKDCPKCQACDPEACPPCEPPDPPEGYDEVDYTTDQLGVDFKAEIKELRKQSNKQLVFNWRNWVPRFYDPESLPQEVSAAGYVSDTYYGALGRLIYGDPGNPPPRYGLKRWMEQIEKLRESAQFSLCQYGFYLNDPSGYPVCTECSDPANPAPATACSSCIMSFLEDPFDPLTGKPNPPCKGSPYDDKFLTIDQDLDDEYVPVKKAIDTFIDQIETFRTHCMNFYNEMAELMKDVEDDVTVTCGNNNNGALIGFNKGQTVSYEWFDSRCLDSTRCHTVTVNTGNFKVPQAISVSSGDILSGEKGIMLTYYRQKVEVTVTRNDPGNVRMNNREDYWNYSGGSQIIRASTAEYRALGLKCKNVVKLQYEK